jgi:hypothetical protein
LAPGHDVACKLREVQGQIAIMAPTGPTRFPKK